MARCRAGIVSTVFAYFFGVLVIVCFLTVFNNSQRKLHFHEHDSDKHVTKRPTPVINTDTTPTSFVESKEDVFEVNLYLKHQEWICQQRIKNRTADLDWCPCLPPNLKGRIPVVTSDDMDWGELETVLGDDVLIGGEWKPPHCTPHTRLAVIIPCRDRDGHLRVLLRHLYPILKRQLLHIRIFIVDQNFPVIFNKASMMNIGFLESMKRFDADCVMFHDVDHLVEDDRALMRCGPDPHHYAIALDDWGYRLLYSAAYGGVVALTPEMFWRVNGFSNRYFGWGGEDDDMGTRIRQFYRIFRPPMAVTRYTTLKHKPDGGNPKNDIRHQLMEEQWQKYQNGSYDGLSDLKYTLHDFKANHLYSLIQANIDVTSLSYPSHPVLKYSRYEGVCSNPDNIIDSRDISWTTCRYLCDTLTKPCYGFSYNSLGGGTRCSLLSTICRLSTNENGSTYIKVGGWASNPEIVLSIFGLITKQQQSGSGN